MLSTVELIGIIKESDVLLEVMKRSRRAVLSLYKVQLYKWSKIPDMLALEFAVGI